MSDEKQGGVFKDIFLNRSVRGSLKIQKSESTSEVKPAEAVVPVEAGKTEDTPSVETLPENASVAAVPVAVSEKAAEEAAPAEVKPEEVAPVAEKADAVQVSGEAVKVVEVAEPVKAAVATPEVAAEAKPA